MCNPEILQTPEFPAAIGPYPQKTLRNPCQGIGHSINAALSLFGNANKKARVTCATRAWFSHRTAAGPSLTDPYLSQPVLLRTTRPGFGHAACREPARSSAIRLEGRGRCPGTTVEQRLLLRIAAICEITADVASAARDFFRERLACYWEYARNSTKSPN